MMSEISIARKINSFYNTVKTTGALNTYLLNDVIARVLDVEFQKATKNYPNFDITPPANTLSFKFKKYGRSGGTAKINARFIATKIAEYWAKAIAPGTPVKYPHITVTNDAMKIIEPLTADILSLRTSHIRPEGYIAFARVIIKNIYTINWTIIERDSDGHTAIFLGKVV